MIFVYFDIDVAVTRQKKFFGKQIFFFDDKFISNAFLCFLCELVRCFVLISFVQCSFFSIRIFHVKPLNFNAIFDVHSLLSTASISSCNEKICQKYKNLNCIKRRRGGAHHLCQQFIKMTGATIKQKKKKLREVEKKREIKCLSK